MTEEWQAQVAPWSGHYSAADFAAAAKTKTPPKRGYCSIN
jgi:hypothetical protein